MSETGPSFTGIGPFEDGLPPSHRGQRLVWLTEAAQKVWECRQAGIPTLLGRAQDPEPRAKALATINALPSRAIRELLAAYGAKAKGR